MPDFALSLTHVEGRSAEESIPDLGRLFEALLGVFRRLAADRLLLLVIEDIHWADASTIALLGYLTRNLSGAMVLAATYRGSKARQAI